MQFRVYEDNQVTNYYNILEGEEKKIVAEENDRRL